MTYFAVGRAKTDDGNTVELAATAEGHLEVALHAPRLPFGSVHAEGLTPVFQVDAVYGVNTKLVKATTGRSIAGAGSGGATAANEMFQVSTGTTSYSFGTIQSRRRLRYRAGQGAIGRCAGLFTSGVANSIQVLGFGTAESGFYFGYNGTAFGILHVRGGVREVHTLTITTASTATNDYSVTLPNGDAVTVTGATNSGNTARTAYEISRGTFPGWEANSVGATVVFLRSSAGATGGSFSLAQPSAGTPAAGSDVTTTAGVASSDSWVAQTAWNGDKLDGTGPSGVTLDPTKGNVYQINIQYLGFGTVEFRVEVALTGNNSDFVTVHTLNFPNARTTPHVTQPSFPFTMAAYSAGSTTNVTVYAGSAAGFIEGGISYVGPRMSYYRETNGFVGSTAATYYPLFTVRNGLTYKNRANQSVIRLIGLSCSHDDATPLSFVLIRNATLVGNPSFAAYSTNSATYWDQAATSCTITDNEQIEHVLNIGQSGGGNFPFADKEITLQPGEAITLAARAVTGTATYVIGTLATREDQ